jgi:glycerate 2-kinase
MTEEKRDVTRILKNALDASSPESAMGRHIFLENNILSIMENSFPVPSKGVYIIGAGKASSRMARALKEILGEKMVSGIVNTKCGYGYRTKRVRINECGHPLPDKKSLEGTEEIIAFLKERKREDLILALISGGGSSLLAKPEEGISLSDKIKTNNILLRCGASIHEINCVRKHISAIKGGKLASMTKARVVCLLISDVVGDDPSTIASGPFAPDDTTFREALFILEKYDIKSRVPSAILLHIHEGVKGKRRETIRNTKAKHFVIARNHDALKAAEMRAGALGYNTLLLSSMVEGESRDVARFHAQIAKQILENDVPVKKPACIISGGETTVTVKGKGKGGPNCEFVLSAAIEIAGKPITVAAIDTDGEDFTDAAGAIVDGETVSDIIEAKKYLEKNDSYTYFKKKKALIFMGPTGTNVNDVRVVIVGKIR